MPRKLSEERTRKEMIDPLLVVASSREIESLLGRTGESERQVEGLFESLLAEAFS